MKRSIIITIFVALALLSLLVSAVSAVSITESPDVVQPGQQITLTISGLPDGASFSLNIGGKFTVTPGQHFSFETRQFNMPFSLTQGTVSATTHGTRTTVLSVAKGDATVQVGNAADGNGDFTVSKAYEISNGVYDYLTLSGLARTDTSLITSNMNLYGTKNGPSDSVITFTVNGIDNGEVYLTVLVNGQQVIYKDVIIGNGIATPTPTPSPAPEATTVEPEEPTSPAEPTATTATTSTAPVYSAVVTASTAATETMTTAPPTTAAPSVFSSADRKVTLETEGVDYAALLMVSNANPPANWLMIGNAYSIAPDSLAFPVPATLSFAVPPASGDYAYFIAELKNNEWVVVPSSAGPDTIDAKVNNVGTYALMAYKPESTIPQTTGAETGQPTAEATVTVRGSPKVASIAQAQTPAPAPSRSPIDPLTIIGALAVSSAAFLVFRKEE